MSGSTTCYGRTGPQAGGDQKVAELLSRSTNGQFEALTSFDATLMGVVDQGLVPWTAALVELTLLGHQWLTLAAWERTTVFLDALMATNGLDDVSYRQVDMLCDMASKASLKTLGLQAEVSQGKKPGLKQLERLSLPPLTQSNCAAVWAMVENVFSRANRDLVYVDNLGVPAGMHKVHQMLVGGIKAKAAVFNHLQAEWKSAMSVESRMQVARQAVSLADHFYAVNQQIWTPYLVGREYTDIVRAIMTFNRLQLGFDPWILTDPSVADSKVTDVASCRELAAFWETVADPSVAKSLQDEVTQLVRTGSLAIQPGKTYRIAPWHPHYVARSSVSVGGVAFGVGDLFTLYPRGAAGQRTLEVRSTGHVGLD